MKLKKTPDTIVQATVFKTAFYTFKFNSSKKHENQNSVVACFANSTFFIIPKMRQTVANNIQNIFISYKYLQK
jgi:hypothetical protein